MSDEATCFPFRHALVVVAHPDDETLWAGGLILSHPQVSWTVVTLCRRSDPDRAFRFHRAMERLCAVGHMGDLDDGPEQAPLDPREVSEEIASLCPERQYDLIVTHGPRGEYARHRRHEEASAAVAHLWGAGDLTAAEAWMFAYEDGGKRYMPRAVAGADREDVLSDGIWRSKYAIITDVYGFSAASWEARVTPRVEAFWCFRSAAEYRSRLTLVRAAYDEGTGAL